VPAETQLAMFLRARILLERATRWLLRNRPRPLEVEASVAHFRAGAESLAAAVDDLLSPADRDAARRSAKDLVSAGVPQGLADRIAHVVTLVPALDLVEVAAASGVGLDDVAGIYFAIDARLELHALRSRIAALPREQRWEALARRALWEDLQNEHRALVSDVLAETADGPVAARVVAWVDHNRAALDRCIELLADIKAGGTADLATLSVAVREIRNLIEATVAPVPSEPEPTEPETAPVGRN
jgi:glutamate dehydrogenase